MVQLAATKKTNRAPPSVELVAIFCLLALATSAQATNTDAIEQQQQQQQQQALKTDQLKQITSSTSYDDNYNQDLAQTINQRDTSNNNLNETNQFITTSNFNASHDQATFSVPDQDQETTVLKVLNSSVIEDNFLSQLLKKAVLHDDKVGSDDATNSDSRVTQNSLTDINNRGFTLDNETGLLRLNGHELNTFIAVSTAAPYVQLTAVRSPDYTEQTSTPDPHQADSQINTSDQMLSSTETDDNDRHIQYDVVQQTTPINIIGNQEDAGARSTYQQKLHPRQVSNEGYLAEEKLSNYKLADETSTNSSRVNQATNSNNNNNNNNNNSEEGTELNQLAGADASAATSEISVAVARNGTQSERRQQLPLVDSNIKGSTTQSNQLAVNLTNSIGQQTARSSNSASIQPRSMNTVSAMPPLATSSARNAPHTRPPYATYDTFQHRTGTEGYQPFATPISNLSVVDVDNNLMHQPATNASQQELVVNSIGRISSQLATESARGPIKQTVGLYGTGQIQIVDGEEPTTNQTSSMDADKQHTSQTLKLSPTSHLVELNPIPIGSGMPPSGQLSNLRENSLDGIAKDRYYLSSDNFNNNILRIPQHHQQQQLYAGSNRDDRYNSLASSKNYPENNKMMAGGSSADEMKQDSRHSEQQQQESKTNDLKRRGMLMSNAEVGSLMNGDFNTHTSLVERDLQSEGGSQHASYQQRINQEPHAGATANGYADRDRDRDRHHLYEHQIQQGQGKSHAASLINVTAPMTPPLSATEAMESSLQSSQSGSNLLHQASGFSSPPQEPALASQVSSSLNLRQPAGGQQLTAARTPAQQQTSQQLYYVNQQAPGNSDQAIYSQPANLFSPKPPTNGVSANSNYNNNNNNNNNNINSNNDLSSPDSSSTVEERMRLNRNSLLAAARRPTTTAGYNAPGSSLYNQTSSSSTSASGFRSPSPLQAAASYTSATSVQPPSAWPSRRVPNFPPSVHYFNSASFAGLTGGASSGSPQVSVSPSGGGIGPMTSSSSPYSAGPTEPRQQQQALSSSTANPTTTESMQAQLVSTMHSPTSTAQVASISSTQTRPPYMSPGLATTANGTFLAGNQPIGGEAIPSSIAAAAAQASAQGSSLSRPVFNLTRVEHISAECSNDLIRTVIVFNGTFKGIIYSMNYVRDSNCIYINGTGKNKYEFSIRLNECGTLNKQELHPPSGNNAIQRRDQVMQNTLTIQYNPIIEQEWDEHFRVSCEYGSDYWKTVSFAPFKVETNTGSPVVFTVNPPQCQMEILRGHGMVGPRQEIQGAVTVGDPLTLLIHMRSEKAGYDILVKNCIAHNGGHQKMQLIDTNGCVVNERFISPFRGTYNDNDMKHVTLFSYLKAFRFTGTSVLYLECEIHMCQSSCPPQMCYWRRLSKRSAALNHTQGPDHAHLLGQDEENSGQEFDTQSSDVNHEQSGVGEPTFSHHSRMTFNLPSETVEHATDNHDDDDDDDDDEKLADHGELANSRNGKRNKTSRSSRHLRQFDSKPNKNQLDRKASGSGQQQQINNEEYGQISVTRALEVRQEPFDSGEAYSFDNSIEHPAYGSASNWRSQMADNFAAPGGAANELASGVGALMCYRRAEVLAFLFTSVLLLLVAVSATVGCCWRAASLKSQERRKKFAASSVASCISSANLSSNGSLTSDSYASIASGGAQSNYKQLPQQQQQQQQQQHHHHHSQQASPQLTSAYHKALNAMGPILHYSARHKSSRPPF